jgi:hypothetical protein
MAIGVRGQSGAAVFNTFDIQSIRISSGAQVFYQNDRFNQRFDDRRRRTETDPLTTFDPTGMSTPFMGADIEVKTGDDLRDDNFATLMVIFRDGSIGAVSYSKLSGNSTTSGRLLAGSSSKSLMDIASLTLITSGLPPLGTRVGGGYTYDPARTEDFWDLQNLVIRAKLSDGDTIERRFPRILGRYGMGRVNHQSFSPEVVLPSGIERPRRDLPVVLALLIRPDSRMTSPANDAADLEARFTYEGRSQEEVAAGRERRNQPLFGGRDNSSIWAGGPSFSRYLGWASAESNAWRSWTNEINGVRLRLRPFGSSSLTPYSGPDVLRVEGVLLLQKNRGRSGNPFTNFASTNQFDGWVVLGASFRSFELNSRNPETVIPIRYRRLP